MDRQIDEGRGKLDKGSELGWGCACTGVGAIGLLAGCRHLHPLRHPGSQDLF